MKNQEKNLRVRKASPQENQNLRKAAMKLAKAWASWHDHSGLMQDDEVLNRMSDLFDALGVEMGEDEKTGLTVLVPLIPAAKPSKSSSRKGLPHD